VPGRATHRKAWRSITEQDLAWHDARGAARQAELCKGVPAKPNDHEQGAAGSAYRIIAALYFATRSQAWQAWHGGAKLGIDQARQAKLGLAVLDKAVRGPAEQAWHGSPSQGNARRSLAGLAVQGLAMQTWARLAQRC
jgi:hypothetical protein